jgi:hypothetical protein
MKTIPPKVLNIIALTTAELAGPKLGIVVGEGDGTGVSGLCDVTTIEDNNSDRAAWRKSASVKFPIVTSGSEIKRCCCDSASPVVSQRNFNRKPKCQHRIQD